MVFRIAVEVSSLDFESAPIYSLIGVTDEILSVMLLNLEQFVTKKASSGFHHHDVITAKYIKGSIIDKATRLIIGFAF